MDQQLYRIVESTLLRQMEKSTDPAYRLKLARARFLHGLHTKDLAVLMQARNLLIGPDQDNLEGIGLHSRVLSSIAVESYNTAERLNTVHLKGIAADLYQSAIDHINAFEALTQMHPAPVARSIAETGGDIGILMDNHHDLRESSYDRLHNIAAKLYNNSSDPQPHANI